MSQGLLVTTFPNREAFAVAEGELEALGLPFDVVSPEPGYRLVGAPAIVLAPEVRTRVAAELAGDMPCSGWVDYRPSAVAVPREEPPTYEEDLFGRAGVVVLAACVADRTKIRFVAHISGDLTRAFPYMNAEMKSAYYNPNGPTFTFMEKHRLVSAYARRVAVAKADGIVDAWRVLEALRRGANETWARRAEIEPSYERREKPPALEIYLRLPRTNCGACGETNCLAFAVKLWQGETYVDRCAPVFRGDHTHLRDVLMEVCAGLGVAG